MAPDGAKSGRGCLGGRVYRACRGQAGATRFRHIAEIGGALLLPLVGRVISRNLCATKDGAYEHASCASSTL